MQRFSTTHGLNLVGTFLRNQEDNKGKTTRFRARSKGYDRNGEPNYTDFTVLSINPVKSNLGFTAATVATHTGATMELHVRHNASYLVPTDQ